MFHDLSSDFGIKRFAHRKKGQWEIPQQHNDIIYQHFTKILGECDTCALTRFTLVVKNNRYLVGIRLDEMLQTL